MKFEKLAVELDRKDKCDRLGLLEFFNEKICGIGSCKLCNRIPICTVEYTGYCPDCLLYVWKVKNNWFSKNLFKLKYNFIVFRKELKEFVSDIWEDFKDEPFMYVLGLMTFFMIILMFSVAVVL